MNKSIRRRAKYKYGLLHPPPFLFVATPSKEDLFLSAITTYTFLLLQLKPAKSTCTIFVPSECPNE